MEEKKGYTRAQIEARNRHNQKKYKGVSFRVLKSVENDFETAVNSALKTHSNMSKNTWYLLAVINQLQADGIDTSFLTDAIKQDESGED